MNSQILIKTANDWYEFTKSKTGQLDFAGKWEKNALPDVKDAQVFTSSTYFTPSYYVFIDSKLNFNPVVYVAPDVDVSDKDTFDYLVHIGPILAAMETKNSLLAGELFLRRRIVFDKYAQLTQFILEPLCVEIVFSLCYGRMAECEPWELDYVYESVVEKLDFDSSKETIEQAFTRWLKKNSVKITLPLVGTNFYSWEAFSSPSTFRKLCDNIKAEDFPDGIEKIRKVRQDFYESLKTVVQAEPYNQYDKNSIIVCIENPMSKISGNPGLEKAGHLRALAAAIIREAKPKKMNFGGKLISLCDNQIVVELEV